MADKEKKEIQQSNPVVQGLTRFFRETKGELGKVTWPTRQEAINLTGIVLAVMVVMAIVLGLFDYLGAQLINLALG